MGWFDASQRGLALGIRQAAVPVGGLVGALVLPQFTVHHAYVFLGCMCLVGAAAGAIFLREPAALPLEVEDVEWSLSDRRLWRLCTVSGLYVVAQMAILSFVVLYLHDERGMGKGEAAAVLGAVQVVAIALRVGAGRWSDKLRTAHRPARSDRRGDERLPRGCDCPAVRAARLARPGFRRRRLADDGLERRRLRCASQSWPAARGAVRRSASSRPCSPWQASRPPSASRPSSRRARGALPTGLRPRSRSAAGWCFARCEIRRRRGSQLRDSTFHE